jgi:hypothetical protein
MLEVIFGLSILEFIASAVILIDFGPEVIKKIKRWGNPKKWFS